MILILGDAKEQPTLIRTVTMGGAGLTKVARLGPTDNWKSKILAGTKSHRESA